jgi:hypothetical protein
MLEGTKFDKRRDHRIPVSLELLTKIVTECFIRDSASTAKSAIDGMELLRDIGLRMGIIF